MMGTEKDGWNELLHILKQTEDVAVALSGGDSENEVLRCRQHLETFIGAAAAAGKPELQKAGVELEKYLSCQVEPAGSVDAAAAFGFAISTLIDRMRDANGKGPPGPIDIDEVLEILGLSGDEPASVLTGDELPPEDVAKPSDQSAESPAQSVSGESDQTPQPGKLEEVLKNLAGDLSYTRNGKRNGKRSLTFTGSPESLEKIEALLRGENAPQPQTMVVPEKYEKLLIKGQEFMDAFSSGNIGRAQEILMSLADSQTQSGLYKEIGTLARGLHDSIHTFLNTMDPSLMEMVEDRIPDTGNRLGHMLALTEKAANTTLDHVEAMQERLKEEQQHLANLRELTAGLHAIGDKAADKLEKGAGILAGLDTIMNRNGEDLDAILSAQDYQDLSGQIIHKIMKLLEDLEHKLVNMIRTFGVKVEAVRKEDESELYGPAHGARVESVHSQDEVDSLLAEFGF